MFYINDLNDFLSKQILIPLIIVCVLAIVVAVAIFFLSVKKNSNSSMINVVVPDYKSDRKDNMKEKAEAEKIKGAKKHGGLKRLMKEKGWDEKIRRWYVRAGHYEKTYEDLFISTLKMTFVGLILGGALYVIVGNPLVFLLTIICILIPVVNLYADIKERESMFRADFPYFLKTLSFILGNGSNMLLAFTAAVNKQNPSILKEVMSDVLIAQRVNGGDFGAAFATIIDKIDCDETREFVEVVQSNLEKGVGIAEIFSVQSESIERFISAKKRKKIKGIENKILLPILLALGGIALFFF